MRTLSFPPPCLSSSSYSLHTNNNNRLSTTFSSYKCFHFLTPHSSLKQTKKQPSRINNTDPSRLKRLFNPKSENDDDKKKRDESEKEEEEDDGAALKGTLLAGVLLVGFVGGFASVGYIYREPINTFLNQFSGFIEGYGSAGYALFVAVYAGLEILAIPAIPLTMSAGLLFGSLTGTIIVSISGTMQQQSSGDIRDNKYGGLTTGNNEIKTTTTGPGGKLAYKRIPYGMRNGPAAFQWCMLSTLSDTLERIRRYCDEGLARNKPIDEAVDLRKSGAQGTFKGKEQKLKRYRKGGLPNNEEGATSTDP